MEQLKRDFLISNLLEIGFVEVGTRSKKYRVFEWPHSTGKIAEHMRDRKIFIGKKGAFRIGRTASVSISILGTRTQWLRGLRTIVDK